jgi:hypothetical protein
LSPLFEYNRCLIHTAKLAEGNNLTISDKKTLIEYLEAVVSFDRRLIMLNSNEKIKLLPPVELAIYDSIRNYVGMSSFRENTFAKGYDVDVYFYRKWCEPVLPLSNRFDNFVVRVKMFVGYNGFIDIKSVEDVLQVIKPKF